MIRVLVVDDSPVARELLIHILNSDPGIKVIGAAANGKEAVEFARHSTPDLITMDIHMPEMDGFEASRIIMETNPVPIVIITGNPDMRELEISFRAIETGALTVLQKPQGIGHPDHQKSARNLLTMIKLMSEIKVVRRWARKGENRPPSPKGEHDYSIGPRSALMKVVAIGASTGGPPVIEKILAALPKDFPLPILIVQHMAEGFIRGFAEWLGQTSVLPVHVAFHGGMTRLGHVYVAPNGVQMGMDAGGRISCRTDPPENGLRPSVSYLFRAVATVFGQNSIGVLLTGMGRDGAVELNLMKKKGAVTIAQDKESSAVYGMPGEAVRLDAARYVLPADRIALVLANIAMANNKREEQPLGTT